MKKPGIINRMLVIFLLTLVVCGCGNNDDLKAERNHLQIEISEMQNTLDDLNNQVAERKEELGMAKYIVTFNIRQTHYTLSISEHLKDAMNDITIEIPVDKEYYDNVEVGDVIDDSFRLGSLIMKGSFGSWKVTVENKEIR